MAFTRATRKKVAFKMALTGPSGSGKTMSALYLARGLAGPEGRIALLDTENGSASIYSDKVVFDADSVEAPYTVQKYITAIYNAAEMGYDVLVIDSLTHAWAGEGGLLSQKEALDQSRPGSNSFTNWAGITKQQEQLKNAILQAQIHVIVTMRSKQEYILETADGRKTAPKKVGMAPIQRDGIEYEFSTVLDVGMSHDAFVSKDRTGLFEGVVGVLSVKHGQQIREWLEGGAEEAQAPQPQPSQESAQASGGLEFAFLEAVRANGLYGRIDVNGKPSRKKMYALVDTILDIPPQSGDIAPSAKDFQDAINALPEYAKSQQKRGPAPKDGVGTGDVPLSNEDGLINGVDNLPPAPANGGR